MCNIDIFCTLLDNIVTLYIWIGTAILMVALVVVVMVAVTMGYNRYRARTGMCLWLTQCMNHVMVGTSDAATSDGSVPRPPGVYDVTVSSRDHANDVSYYNIMHYKDY